ncbi:MAG: trypsin-like peptidase domain-containing protein [Anaerolineae bacterium]
MKRAQRTLLMVLALALLLGLAGASSTLALDRKVRLQAIKAVVQIGPVVEFTDARGNTEVRTMGWGSGTIISADGLILTNYHVVDTSDLDLPSNARVVEDRLAIYITTRSDRPPTLTYLAEVAAAAPERDLAVLRIVSTIRGDKVDWRSVKLPFLALGDANQLEPGDPIYILGYPGIGGETVTFTQGVVSGFTSQAGLGDRAWIKTDATISGGNSGGTCLNDAGQLVAVPTQVGRGGVEGKPEYVDCRPLADTNNNGRLDEYDVCVPVGGFINALRPTNLAQDLIAAALRGGTSGKPKPPATTKGVQVTGVILDADTGWALPGAMFIALNPGVTYDEWESDDEVYSAATADSQGHFVLPDKLRVGKSYTLVAGLKGYEPVYEDGVYVDESAGPVVDLTIRIRRR